MNTILNWNVFLTFRNTFGVNPYGGVYPQQYYASQGYNNQYGTANGYYNSGIAYPGVSPYATGYPSSPYGGQVAQGYGYSIPPTAYGYQQPYYQQQPAYPVAPQPPFGGHPFSTVQQPLQPYPPQQPPFNNVTYPSNGYYDTPRSRHSSRQRSRGRRQPSSSSSSSSDDQPQRHSPFVGASSSGDYI